MGQVCRAAKHLVNLLGASRFARPAPIKLTQSLPIDNYHGSAIVSLGSTPERVILVH